MTRLVFSLIGALPIAFAIVSGCSSSGSSSTSSDDQDAFAHHFCVDPASYRPTGVPDDAVLTVTQHVKAASCEGYLLFYAEQGTKNVWDAVVTNCSPNIHGFPPDCLVGVSSSGTIDPVVASMECVCCIGTQCGRACHPVKLDGGGGVTCASYSSDFASPPLDPQQDPSCDCTGF